MEIIADLHTHTLASDHGYSTIQEMCAQAATRKLKALAITDHAPGMVDSANSWHFGGMWIVPRFIEGVALLRGAELNVQDFEGTLDLDERSIQSLDLVIASLHSYVLHPASRDENTTLLEKLCRHGHIDVIGHPVKDFEFDYEYIARVAADTGTALELNGLILFNHGDGRAAETVEQTKRLVRACMKADTQMTVSSDAHISFLLAAFNGIPDMLDELGTPPELVVNSSARNLNRFLKSRRREFPDIV